MAYKILIWLLRIIHIGGGVFWVGGSLIMTFFIVPTVAAMGESGQKFVGYLMNNQKFSNRMAAASGSTILAGIILFGLDAPKARFAMGLGIGAAFALVGFVFGILIGRTTRAMAQLGPQIQGKPTSEQLARMQTLQNQQALYSRLSTVALILAVVFMAIARYL